MVGGQLRGVTYTPGLPASFHCTHCTYACVPFDAAGSSRAKFINWRRDEVRNVLEHDDSPVDRGVWGRVHTYHTTCRLTRLCMCNPLSARSYIHRPSIHITGKVDTAEHKDSESRGKVGRLRGGRVQATTVLARVPQSWYPRLCDVSVQFSGSGVVSL